MIFRFSPHFRHFSPFGSNRSTLRTRSHSSHIASSEFLIAISSSCGTVPHMHLACRPFFFIANHHFFKKGLVVSKTLCANGFPLSVNDGIRTFLYLQTVPCSSRVKSFDFCDNDNSTGKQQLFFLPVTHLNFFQFFQLRSIAPWIRKFQRCILRRWHFAIYQLIHFIAIIYMFTNVISLPPFSVNICRERIYGRLCR